MIQETVTLEQVVIIPAPRAKIYATLTNPKIHTQFTGAEATGEVKTGEVFITWDGYVTGVYRELVLNNKIVADWSTSE